MSGKAAVKVARRERRRAREEEAAAADATDGVDGPAAPDAAGRADLLLAAAIVLGAFALRIVYVLMMRDSPLFEHPIVDARYHDEWATAIANGEPFVRGPYLRAPLYAWMLGAIYAVSDHSYLAPRIVQSAIGAASCGLVFAIGRRLFDRRTATVAGVAAATYWILIYFDGELLVPTLAVFLDLSLILLLVRARAAPSATSWTLVGLVLGLSAIARPNVLLFAPAIAGWIWLLHRASPRRAVAYVATVAAACLLVVLPVTIRNYVVGDDFVLVASTGGMNFYIGNNPESDGVTAILPGGPGDFVGGVRAARARAERAMGRELKESEVSDYYFAQGRAFILSQPAAAAELTWRKLRYFFSRWEIPNNKDIPFWTARFAPFTAYLPLGFGIVGPLGLLGLALCRRRALELFPLWGFVVVYTASVVIFFSTARFRAPVLAPLCLLGSFAVLHVVDAVRRDGLRALVVPVAILVPAVLLVHVGDRPGEGNVDAISYESLAQAYARLDESELAKENHRAAIASDPDYLTSRYNLATLLLQEEQYDDALVELQRAAETPYRERRGESKAMVASVQNQLGVVLSQLGRREEALPHFREAIALDPDPTHRARGNLTSTLLALDRRAEAIDALSEALALDPGLARERAQLAELLVAEGRVVDAIPHYDALLRATPGDETLRMVLADQLSGVGRHADAIELLRAAPGGGSPNLWNNLAWKLATAPDSDVRDGAESVRIARRACPNAPDCHPAILDTLAAGYAETGDFPEAIRLARLALDAMRAIGGEDAAHDAALIRTHVESYERGEPFREVDGAAPR